MTIRFETPFVKLPIRFDPEALVAEARALPEDAWVPHPDGFPGNSAVRLISPDGAPTDASSGDMQPTEYLGRMPFVKELMGWIGSVWGRSRLMGLGPGAKVPLHVDSHYYWRTHIRIHVPIVTNPAVKFTCGGETVHMEPGTCWVFDSYLPHEVVNSGDERRIHLVIDTVGGGRLPELIAAGKAEPNAAPMEFLAGRHGQAPLALERYNSPAVMSPWEVRSHIAFAFEKALPHPQLSLVAKKLDRFLHEWGAVWAQHGPQDSGRPLYAALMKAVMIDLQRVPGGGTVMLTNQTPLYYMFERLVLENAVAPPEAAPALRQAG